MLDGMCKIQCVNGSASRTSWTDQPDGPAGRTSSFYLKPWPVRIFKDFPFSSYIVAASESDEGLVYIVLDRNILFMEIAISGSIATMCPLNMDL